MKYQIYNLKKHDKNSAAHDLKHIVIEQLLLLHDKPIIYRKTDTRQSKLQSLD